jgi:TRAP-type C4-dicarboxylate transport system substrate-binding protein
MLRPAIMASLSLAVLFVPGAQKPAEAGNQIEIKIATLAPRNSPFMREFERLDKKLRAETNDGVRIRLYTSGSAGDENDVLRKMRSGQLDSAMITSDGLGLVLPEVNVLRTPGVVNNYKQLEAVQNVMLPEFDKSFEEKGFKLIAWGEAGEYRYFSREPVKEPSDIKKMRPWLWPSSPIMKEMWKAIGAVPVPLGMGEVYGAVQTKMIDLVESTAIAYVALQWQNTDLAYVTDETSGVLIGAWLINKSIFDKLEPEWQKIMMRLAQENNQATRLRTREADGLAFKRLIERGLKVTKLNDAGKQQMVEVRKHVRAAMTGRIYSAELLARVQQIADNAK